MHRRREPVGAGEIDDDRVGAGGSSGAASSCAEAREHELGVGCERPRVRNERRQVAVESDVERGRGAPRQRVRAERDELELRVREHAVERSWPA